VEDCFRKALQKYGAPEMVYFDNGKQYRTTWMKAACARMGIRLLYAKPYSPEATGKVERFNRVVDAFLSEAALEKPKSLDKLNELFQVWLEECYQNQPHSALAGISPQTAYRGSKNALRFLKPELLAEAFLRWEERRVDKAGCISFSGKQYEVGLSFIGCKVNVIYDPADLSELSIKYGQQTPWKARELTIGENAGKRPKLPETLTPLPAQSSRLLNAAAKQNQHRKTQRPPVIVFRSVNREDGSHV
jgi:putative transposase